MATVTLQEATETIKNLNSATVTLTSSVSTAGHADGLYALINNLISDLSSIKATVKTEEKKISADINAQVIAVAGGNLTDSTTLNANSVTPTCTAATLFCSAGRGDKADTTRYAETGGTATLYPAVLTANSKSYSENAVYAVIAECSEIINQLKYGELGAETTEAARHADTKVTLAAS